MTSDASLPPNAPMANGTLTPSAPDSHGEADASSTPDLGAPPRETLSLKEVCADVHARITAFLAAPATDATLRSTQMQVKIGIGIIRKALEDYEFKHLSLSYNGGKDCLVLLLLYLSVLHTHFNDREGPSREEEGSAKPAHPTPNDDDEKGIEPFPSTIPSIYAKPPDPFPLVTSFVDSSSARYHLSLIHISTNPGSSPKSKSHSSPPPPTEVTLPSTASHTHTTATTATTLTTNDPPTDPSQVITFRDAFALYLSHHHPTCQAIFVGTRRTDPHGATLHPFQMTDGLWPRFMRIHPVLDFTLAQVWTFLRHPTIRGDGEGSRDDDDIETQLRPEQPKREIIDYCDMYDQGYTSLGGVGDTHPNPNLRDQSYQGGYKPAWTMTLDQEERLGRE